MRPIIAREWPPLDLVPSLVGVILWKHIISPLRSVCFLLRIMLIAYSLFLSFFSSPIPASESESCGDHSDHSPYIMATWFRRRLPNNPVLCSGETTRDKCERRIQQLAEKTSLLSCLTRMLNKHIGLPLFA